MKHTKESLIAFTEKVKQAFLDKRIHCPIHLHGGAEDHLIEVFRGVRPQDWCFATYRGHLHAILKGIPEEEVFRQICEGRSMFLMSKEHRFLTSAIVGGHLPMACGVAMTIKRLGLDEMVYVFCGDMCARTGIFHEFRSYCAGQGLPVAIVVENNFFSTDTPTAEAWGSDSISGRAAIEINYSYERTQPHCGCGVHVSF